MPRRCRVLFTVVGAALTILAATSSDASAQPCFPVGTRDVLGHCHITQIGAELFNWRYQKRNGLPDAPQTAAIASPSSTMTPTAKPSHSITHRLAPGPVDPPKTPLLQQAHSGSSASGSGSGYAAIPNNALAATSNRGAADCNLANSTQVALGNPVPDAGNCGAIHQQQADDRGLVRKLKDWAAVLSPEFGADTNPIGAVCGSGVERLGKTLAGEAGEKAAKSYNHAKDVNGAMNGDNEPEPTTTAGKVFKACTQ